MGYRKIPTIYTLTEFPEDEGLVVRMKAIRIGKLRKLTRVLGNMGDDAIADNLEEIFSLLMEGLVSWNLEDEDGQPVPTTMEGIEGQEMPLVLGIMNLWMTSMTGVDDELGKDSLSGASFPGQPLTMEAL